MLSIFTRLADLIVVQLLGLDKASHLGGSLHFFIEDTSKIFFLLVVMIYAIAASFGAVVMPGKYAGNKIHVRLYRVGIAVRNHRRDVFRLARRGKISPAVSA